MRYWICRSSLLLEFIEGSRQCSGKQKWWPFLRVYLERKIYTWYILGNSSLIPGLWSSSHRFKASLFPDRPTNTKCLGFIFWWFLFFFAYHWHFLLLASNYLTLIFPICFLNYFAAILLHFLSMIQGDNLSFMWTILFCIFNLCAFFPPAVGLCQCV